ncbi:MAG: hypothetical protein ABSH52_24250 [Terriglobia bacterium]|jgi:hypothetical protein
MLLAEVTPPKRLTESTNLNYRKSERRENGEDLVQLQEFVRLYGDPLDFFIS